MKRRDKFLWLLIVFGSMQMALAEYEIKGKLNISDGWQHQIFLATVHKMDDYYIANPEFIIQVGRIESDGTFVLKGDNLPLEKRYYRLYLVKDEHTEFDACLYFDRNDNNFVHLILDNNTKVEIQSEADQYSPFGEYELIGDAANQELRKLSRLIFPSFYFHEIKFTSELQFARQKYNRDLFAFADSCPHILVSLAAIINTDMDRYYPLESERYLDFGKRLSAQLNNHSYTEDYFRKMNYYSGGTNSISVPIWIYVIITFLGIALAVALVRILTLERRINSIKEDNTSFTTNQRPIFTRQEEKILFLILNEKSNKEIASELFIELSTVKTHINKLYSKLGAKNRAEAKNIAKRMDLMGV